MRLYLDRERLMNVARDNKGRYARAAPFPHIVLDGLFPDEALTGVLSEFPDPGSPVWKEYQNYHEGKLETQGEEKIGAFSSMLLYQLNSAPFLQFLEELTGITDLIPDPYLRGRTPSDPAWRQAGNPCGLQQPRQVPPRPTAQRHYLSQPRVDGRVRRPLGALGYRYVPIRLKDPADLQPHRHLQPHGLGVPRAS